MLPSPSAKILCPLPHPCQSGGRRVERAGEICAKERAPENDLVVRQSSRRHSRPAGPRDEIRTAVDKGVLFGKPHHKQTGNVTLIFAFCSPMWGAGKRGRPDPGSLRGGQSISGNSRTTYTKAKKNIMSFESSKARKNTFCRGDKILVLSVGPKTHTSMQESGGPSLGLLGGDHQAMMHPT